MEIFFKPTPSIHYTHGRFSETLLRVYNKNMEIFFKPTPGIHYTHGELLKTYSGYALSTHISSLNLRCVYSIHIGDIFYKSSPGMHYIHRRFLL